MTDDPNRPETEEDAIRAEAVRRLKVRRQMEAARTRASSKSPSSTPEKPGSTTGGKYSTSM